MKRYFPLFFSSSTSCTCCLSSTKTKKNVTFSSMTTDGYVLNNLWTRMHNELTTRLEWTLNKFEEEYARLFSDLVEFRIFGLIQRRKILEFCGGEERRSNIGLWMRPESFHQIFSSNKNLFEYIFVFVTIYSLCIVRVFRDENTWEI